MAGLAEVLDGFGQVEYAEVGAGGVLVDRAVTP